MTVSLSTTPWTPALTQRGAHEVPRESLCAIPIPPRGDRSARWAGIQHGHLADTLCARATHAGLAVIGERWSVDRAGDRLFGYLELDGSSRSFQGRKAQDLGIEARGYAGFDPEIVGLTMGVIHSNDSSFALTLVVMARVLVCSNGLTVEGGAITCRRKHTSGLELAPTLDRGLEAYVERVGRIDETRQRLLECDYSRPRDVDHALVEAGRRRLFPWSKLGQVERLWRSPPHPEFRERTGWSLLNSFTEIAKRFPMAREMRVTDDIRHLVIDCAPNVN